MGGIALADLLRAQLGVRAFPYVNRDGSSVGVAVQRIFRNDPNRVAFLFVNLSTAVIYLAPIESPSATQGIRVGAGGGSLTALWEEDFDLVGYEWRGLADAAGAAYLAIELVTTGG